MQYRFGELYPQEQEIFKDSERTDRARLGNATRALGPEHPETLRRDERPSLGNNDKASLKKLARSLDRPSNLQQRGARSVSTDTLRTQDTLAKSLEGLGHWAEARVLREEVLTLHREQRDAAFMDGLALNIAVTEDASPDDRQCAIELAEEAVELEPRNEQFWRTFGVAHAVSGHWQKSLEAFEHALELGYVDDLVPPSTLERLRQSNNGDDDLRDGLLEFLREKQANPNLINDLR